jgi:ribosomal protein L33
MSKKVIKIKCKFCRRINDITVYPETRKVDFTCDECEKENHVVIRNETAFKPQKRAVCTCDEI